MNNIDKKTIKGIKDYILTVKAHLESMPVLTDGEQSLLDSTNNSIEAIKRWESGK